MRTSSRVNHRLSTPDHEWMNECTLSPLSTTTRQRSPCKHSPLDEKHRLLVDYDTKRSTASACVLQGAQQAQSAVLQHFSLSKISVNQLKSCRFFLVYLDWRDVCLATAYSNTADERCRPSATVDREFLKLRISVLLTVDARQLKRFWLSLIINIQVQKLPGNYSYNMRTKQFAPIWAYWQVLVTRTLGGFWSNG